MSLLVGCIADDFTGASDLAGMLVKSGFRTVQMIGLPQRALPEGTEAVVVALKSRTCPVEDAVRDSLSALAYLREADVRQVYFKYCSTFDSTPDGNIGPVADALLDALGADSRSSARPSRRTGARSTRATCSRETCRSTRAGCATIRSHP